MDQKKEIKLPCKSLTIMKINRRDSSRKLEIIIKSLSTAAYIA